MTYLRVSTEGQGQSGLGLEELGQSWPALVRGCWGAVPDHGGLSAAARVGQARPVCHNMNYAISATSLARTSANSAALTRPLRVALRARQSWLFTWSASTTLGDAPASATSNG